LIDLITPRHALVKLAALIDWEVFDRVWAGFFAIRQGAARDRAAIGGGVALSAARLPSVTRADAL